MSAIAQFHFAVGCCAVLAGFMAMFVKKGSVIHRSSGKVYTLTMLLLCLSAFYLSFERELQFTFLLSCFALYLVITGWLMAKNKDQHPTVTDKLGLIYISLFCITCYALSLLGTALNWHYPPTEPPYGAYAFIGLCATFFLVSDIRLTRQVKITPEMRLKRHISRIGSSLLISTIVFFLGNNHVLPESLRKVPILLSPIVTVIIFTLLYRIAYKKLIGKH